MSKGAETGSGTEEAASEGRTVWNKCGTSEGDKAGKPRQGLPPESHSRGAVLDDAKVGSLGSCFIKSTDKNLWSFYEAER